MLNQYPWDQYHVAQFKMPLHNLSRFGVLVKFPEGGFGNDSSYIPLSIEAMENFYNNDVIQELISAYTELTDALNLVVGNPGECTLAIEAARLRISGLKDKFFFKVMPVSIFVLPKPRRPCPHDER